MLYLIKIKRFLLQKIMPSRFYYQSNKEQYIHAAHNYYNSNKESILKSLKNKYNMLTSEDREKKNEYAKNWYNNLPDDKKKHDKRSR